MQSVVIKVWHPPNLKSETAFKNKGRWVLYNLVTTIILAINYKSTQPFTFSPQINNPLLDAWGIYHNSFIVNVFKIKWLLALWTSITDAGLTIHFCLAKFTVLPLFDRGALQMACTYWSGYFRSVVSYKTRSLSILEAFCLLVFAQATYSLLRH